MKIAHLLPNSAIFPLKKHNGRYQWALRLARLQVEAGHDVTMFCGHGSSDKIVNSWRHVGSLDQDRTSANKKLVEDAFSDTSFDIFHSHYDTLAAELSYLTNKPVVTTQHWFPTQMIVEKLRRIQRDNVVAVPVTKLMQKYDEAQGIIHTSFIYHGIDLNLFKPSLNLKDHNKDFLLYIGRISENKGVLEAIEAAKATSNRLVIIGKVNTSDRSYWEQLLPHIDGDQIIYLGPKSQKELVGFLSDAKALIFPSKSAEAFGQTTIEAQACGTPVIITDVGASSELVIHGKTGYVAQDFKGLIEGINQCESFDSRACIANASSFDQQKMAENYLTLYKNLIVN